MAKPTDLKAGDPFVGWLRRVLLVVLFAVAFGYVESALVVYLRAIYEPIHASLHPDQPPGSLLPLVTVEQLRELGPVHVRRLGIELGRELAAMAMLVVAAALAVRRRGEWVAMFMIAFGVWDITYYLGLKWMIGFPASLLTWDILFLLPVPWLGPVLAPLIVSLTMVAAGLVVLAESGRGRQLQAGWLHWTGITAAALIIAASFCKDYTRTMAGEMPERFNWLMFAAGEVAGLTVFGHALLRTRRARRPGCARGAS